MAYVPVCRTVTRRFGGEANLRMAVSKAVSVALKVSRSELAWPDAAQGGTPETGAYCFCSVPMA